jgi:hypothetical protein
MSTNVTACRWQCHLALTLGGSPESGIGPAKRKADTRARLRGMESVRTLLVPIASGVGHDDIPA